MASTIVNNIRENTKMSFNRGIFDFFMNKYLTQDMSTYSSKDGESLFDFIKIDKLNASQMNMDDYKALIVKLINASIESYKKKGEVFNKDIVVKKIISALNSRTNRLTFSSEELFDNKIDGEKNILIYIDVKGEDIIKLVDSIIDKFTVKNVAYDITTPSFTEMGKGHTDAICIKTSAEELEKVIIILNELEPIIKPKANENDYAKSNWYGINTIKDGVSADTLIGKLFIKAIDEIINEIKNQNPNLSLPDVIVTDKDRKEAYYNALLNGNTDINDKIYNRVLDLIKSNNIDPDNMYIYNSINEQLDVLYKTKSMDDTVSIPDINRTLTSMPEIQANPEVVQQPVEQPQEVIIQRNEESEIDYKKIEIADPAEVSSINESDKIVSDTMEMVGEQVKEIVDEKTVEIPSNEVKSMIPLTDAEKVAMASEIDKVQANIDIENKYLGLLDGIEDWTFESKVKDIDGKEISLLQFLEKNYTLAKVPLTSKVTLLDTTTEDGEFVSGRKFISKYVLDSLKLNATNPNVAGLTLEEIMEKYVEKVETEDLGIIYPEGLTSPSNKSNLIQKLFKKRR